MSSKTSRVLLILAAVVVLLISIPLVTALFVQNEFSVERQIIIERSSDDVLEYVKYVRNHDNFTIWNTMDPDMQKSYTGTDGTVGFVYAWEGNEDVGKGEQEITAIEEGRRVDHELRFKEPFESTATTWMITEPVGENQTEVTWALEGSMPYPMNLLLLFIDMDESIGEDYQYGLDNLKTILESEEFSQEGA